MNPEKFNPSDPKYKKVEDLPKEVQDRYTNVEGGFVRKAAAGNLEYVKKQSSDRYGIYLQKIQSRQKLESKKLELEGVFPYIFGGRQKKIRDIETSLAALSFEKDIDADDLTKNDFILEILTEVYQQRTQQDRKGSVHGSFLRENDVSSQEDVEVLRNREYYKSIIDNYIDTQIDLARVEAFARQREELKRLGHEGFLMQSISSQNYEEWDHTKVTKTSDIISGYLDGKTVQFSLVETKKRTKNDGYHSNQSNQYRASVSGDGGSGTADAETAKALYHTYSTIAIDIGQIGTGLEETRKNLKRYKIPENIDIRIAQIADKVSKEKTRIESEVEREDTEIQKTYAEKALMRAAADVKKLVAANRAKKLVESLLPKTKDGEDVLSEDPIFNFDNEVEHLLSWSSSYPKTFEISSLPTSAIDVLQYFYGDDISQLKTVGQVLNSLNVSNKLSVGDRNVRRSQIWKESV